MCGIAGIAESNPEHIRKMLSAVVQRGPDDQGIWHAENTELSLGHQRLSIVDLSYAGHQPMLSQNGQYVLTYNGEIYNYLTIKKELARVNPHIKWNGTSDTEILLAAIEQWGLNTTLSKLDGMFAFALFNIPQKKLSIVRDSFGEKPVFFSWINNRFAFASQIGAFEKLSGFARRLNRSAVDTYLTLGYSTGIDTLYDRTYRLPSGKILELNNVDLFHPLDKEKILKKLTTFPPSEADKIKSGTDITEDIEFALKNNLATRLMADVPVGIFLSGGIDSSLITALSKSLGNSSLQTFTVGFRSKRFDEAPYAEKIAEYLKTNHHTLYLEEEEILSRVLSLSNIVDEPFGDTSIIPTSFLCEFAKQKVKVALTGDGGDELFGGYSRYATGLKISRLWNSIPSEMRKKIALRSDTILFKNRSKILNNNFLPKTTAIKTSRFLHRLTSANPSELTRSFIGANSLSTSNVCRTLRYTSFEPLHPGTIVQHMMACDLDEYFPDCILVKSDRASMGFGLETRAPFLSSTMLALSKQLSAGDLIKNGGGKAPLKKLLGKYLPETLYERPKSGFSPPLGSWLRGPLNTWANTLLHEDNLRNLPGVDVEFTINLWNAHCKNYIDAAFALWPLLMYADWVKLRGVSL